ncbi:MAG: response regulator [Pigmentiphaga sp.]
MTRTVLVVDDSATLRRIVESALEATGWTVWPASHGQHALDELAARKGVPNLVITDWNMPVMDGLGLLRALRASPAYADLPILVLTTETDDASKEAARDAGATGWLSKPVDVVLLCDIIESVLA